MTDTEHTPLPWTLDTSDLGPDHKEIYGHEFRNLLLLGPDGKRVFGWIVFKDKPHDDQIKVDMDFIVRVCNCHDDLVAALRTIVGQRTQNSNVTKDEWEMATAAAVAALAKASKP